MKCHQSGRGGYLSRLVFVSLAVLAMQPILPPARAQTTAFSANQTVTYNECIERYRALDRKHPQAYLLEYGPTDTGKPLHLFVISPDGDFDPASVRRSKCVVLVMNGIHPGESDGIDASLQLAADLLEENSGTALLRQTVLCILPAYNVGGMLNRGCCSRANQEGPEAYGFRGNARHLDLNRDFIKCDSENTASFARLFHEWDPDLFVDTHVSNGADYPYTMTLISTQHDKLSPPLGDYLKQSLTPALFRAMKAKGDEMTPYVNTFNWGDSPETGISGFMDLPRYSTGFAALFHTIGFVTETHMLKPYPQRVRSTYRLLQSLLEAVAGEAMKIKALRAEARKNAVSQTGFVVDWKLDTAQYENLPFKGYTQKKKPSDVTGLDRTWYDREAPYSKEIRFYDYYVPEKTVKPARYYIVPQAWKDVIARLALNGVRMFRLRDDTVLNAEVYYILDFKTTPNPYEGHYLHSGVTVSAERQALRFFEGDVVVPVSQEKNRYIVETLEPEAPDSWFAWGFFDAILQQKEWFSSYVFEEKALELLNADSELKRRFEAQKNADTAFANSAFQQLYFIYRNSPYFEKSYRRYPVARIDYSLEGMWVKEE